MTLVLQTAEQSDAIRRRCEVTWAVEEAGARALAEVRRLARAALVALDSGVDPMVVTDALEDVLGLVDRATVGLKMARDVARQR